jgi:ketosteroid isomerase-like protein
MLEEMLADLDSLNDLNTLNDLNRAYIDSVLNGDVARFQQLLADDFLCTNPDGSLIDRAAFLRQTAAPRSLTALRADDVRVRVFGSVAIIHGRTAFETVDGRRGSGRYTDVWEKRGGEWRAVAAHVTRL